MKIWVGAWLCVLSAMAQAETCQRVVSGNVTFSIVQLGAPFEGQFTRFGGEVCRNGAAMTSIDVWLEPQSVDTGLAELDEMLQSAILFDTQQHPRATFKSQTISGAAPTYQAVGVFTLKGIARDMQVRFDLNGQNISGKVQMLRLLHEVGTGEWAQTDLLSDEVSVRFEVTLGQ